MALVKLTLITFSHRLSPNSNQWEIFWAINKFLSLTSVTSTFLKRLSWTKTSDCFRNSNFQWRLKQTIRSRQNQTSPLKYLEGLLTIVDKFLTDHPEKTPFSHFMGLKADRRRTATTAYFRSGLGLVLRLRTATWMVER